MTSSLTAPCRIMLLIAVLATGLCANVAFAQMVPFAFWAPSSGSGGGTCTTPYTWAQLTNAGSQMWGAFLSGFRNSPVSEDGNFMGFDIIGQFYSSANQGVTWVSNFNGSNRGGTSSAPFANSSRIYLARQVTNNSTDYIYVSTNYGTTWTALTGSGQKEWGSNLYTSDNGSKVYAIDMGTWNTSGKGGAYSGGYIYRSDDSGVTWNAITSLGTNNMIPDLLQNYPIPISVSGDGQKAALFQPGTITSDGSGNYENTHMYRSIDGGVTWPEITSAGTKVWQGVTYSRDGSRMYAADWGVSTGTLQTYTGGQIYVSTNDGTSWTTGTGLPNGMWNFQLSDDGMKIIATQVTWLANGEIYRSTDGGLTWASISSGLPTPRSYAFTMSHDANVVIVQPSYWDGSNTINDSVYISVDGGTTWVVQTDLPLTASVGYYTHPFLNGTKILAYHNDTSSAYPLWLGTCH